MRSARMLVATALLAGCTIASSSRPPEGETTPAEGTEGPGKPVASTETEPAPEPEPEDDATAGPGSLVAASGTEPPDDEATDPPAEGSGTLQPTDPGPAPTKSGGDQNEDDGKTTLQPKATASSLELPRPLHPETDSTCGKDPGVGQSLQAFSLSTPDGKTITNGTYRGRVLVVNFWGTWCKPCLKELPEFDQIYRRYRKHGMTLLAIATDEEADGVTDFADKRKLAAKLAIGGESYAGKYGSPKFPFTFVVDYKGIIRAAYRGYRPECTGQLEADIREQLEIRAEAKAKRKRSKG